MAKTAIDRVFKYGEKVDIKEYKKFKTSFDKFEKIILPLSEFPSAAAQGCIAIEYRRGDLQTQRILKKINHTASLEDCSMERKYLAKWGGGCALDIGATIENILNKKILKNKEIKLVWNNFEYEITLKKAKIILMDKQ